MIKKTEFDAEIKKYGNSYVVVVDPFLMKQFFKEGDKVKVKLTRVEQ